MLHYNVHGLRVRVQTSDPAIASRIHGRLGRYQVAAQEPDLTIGFHVDRAGEHTIGLPSSAARLLYAWNGGAVHYEDATQRLCVNWDCDHSRVSFDVARGRAEISIDGACVDRGLRLAANAGLTYVLLEGLKRRRVFFVHGAALLSKRGKGMILSGNSGAGKSTAALFATLSGGFALVADDLLLITRQRSGTLIVGIPDDVRLTARSVAMLPPLESGTRSRSGAKTSFQLDQMPGLAIIDSIRPEVLIFPRVADQEVCSAQRISVDRALFELVRHIMMTDQRATQAHLDALVGLARTCPAFELHLGRELATLPPLLEDLEHAF